MCRIWVLKAYGDETPYTMWGWGCMSVSIFDLLLGSITKETTTSQK